MDSRSWTPGPAPGQRMVLAGVLATVALLGIVGACRQAPQALVQGWDEEAFGPLVPHETFPGDCSLCHVPERWDVLRDDFHFDHAQETGYSLAGAHAQASCLRCHIDPHEATAGLDCERCHGQDTWAPRGVVAEHARTRFPLVGAHLGTTCDRCHVQARVGIFEGLPVDCHLCHQDDLARARNPDHVALGWVTDCQRCHTPRSQWGSDGFTHSFFPLTGAHAQLACTACHQNNQFAGTPRDCFSCHSDDYQSASNPDHVANAYPTQCQICHNTSAWRPATFQHESFFPINNGPHSTLDCTDCHTGNVFGAFTCLSCHAHNRADMADEHSDVNGYTYNSQACLTCHPRGRED